MRLLEYCRTFRIDAYCDIVLDDIKNVALQLQRVFQGRQRMIVGDHEGAFIFPICINERFKSPEVVPDVKRSRWLESSQQPFPCHMVQIYQKKRHLADILRHQAAGNSTVNNAPFPTPSDSAHIFPPCALTTSNTADLRSKGFFA